jgi:hypothetical protein
MRLQAPKTLCGTEVARTILRTPIQRTELDLFRGLLPYQPS